MIYLQETTHSGLKPFFSGGGGGGGGVAGISQGGGSHPGYQADWHVDINAVFYFKCHFSDEQRAWGRGGGGWMDA